CKMPSQNFNKTINSVSAEEFPLTLLQIDHEDLAEPIRVVNDREDVTCNGNVYQACGFAVTLPNQPETGAPSAQLHVDNVSRDLVYWIDTSNGAKGATATLSSILRSDPNTVEWTYILNLSNVSMTNSVITANLSYEDLWNSDAVQVKYTPDR